MVRYDAKTKEGKCIFCEIGSGSIQPLGNGKFWETKKFVAWLSPFPNTPGAAVLSPKKHFGSDVLKMPKRELQEFILEAKKVSELLLSFFPDVGRVGLVMEGTGIDHAHIKLFPMHGTGYMKSGEWRQQLSGRKDFFEKYPGFIMSNDGPQTNFAELEELAKKIRTKAVPQKE